MLYNPCKEIRKSHQICKKKKLNPRLSTPTEKLNKHNMKKHLDKNHHLISIFEKETREIINLLPNKTHFLLCNQNIFVLQTIHKNPDRHSIKPGFSFAERHAGTNALALARKLNKAVYVKPDQHYCNYLQKWHCYALPLHIKNKNEGFLKVILSQPFTRELLATIITLKKCLLLSYKIKKYRPVQKKFNLSQQQIEIIKYMAQGLTERNISKKVNLSLSTIKYHKKKIYKKLNARCINTALVKAVKYGIIPFEF